MYDRTAKARRLADADAARYHAAVYALAEVAPDLGHDILRQARPAVEHGHENPLQREIGVCAVRLEPVDQACYHGQALQCVVFALHGHNNRVGGGERCRHEDAERGWAVHDDVVEDARVHHGLEGDPDAFEVVLAAGDFDFRTREVNLVFSFFCVFLRRSRAAVADYRK